MLKFFRKIRQQLLNSGQMKKYFLYAIGEIVLVVLGILIALQINNWNESRKQKVEEKTILKELKLDLETDLQYAIAEGRDRLKSDTHRINTILRFIETEQEFNDTLNRYFGVLTTNFQFHPQMSTYKALEARGIEILSNPIIKKQVLDLYNQDYPILANRAANKVWNILEFGRPLFHTKFKHITGGGTGVQPLDFEQLRTDIDLWNTLHRIGSNSENMLPLLEMQKVKIEQLIQLIEEEIN